MTSIANTPLSSADLAAWAQTRLGDLGIAVTGEITEPQMRQWSRVLRIPTAIGPVWAKSNCPGFAYEAGLVGLLTRHASDHVLHPLATDPILGLMLLPDGGPILSEQRQADRTIERWAAVLREYADLQRRLEAHVPEMLAAGVPDLRPHRMPELYAEILDSPLRIGEPEGMTEEEHAALRRLTGAVASWSDVLADSGTPVTIQHDDLHLSNVFVQDGAGGSGYRIFDWGDAVVSHPFGTLLTATGTAKESFGLSDEKVENLQSDYLRAWPASTPDEARIAMLLALLGRILNWQRAPAEARAAYPGAIPRYLRRFLDDATTEVTGSCR